jgi:transcription initiation factor IIE alpha subunit
MIHFFPIQYTSDQVKVIELAKEKGYITLEDVCTGLDWAQNRAIRALKTLEDTGMAKFRESILTGKQWFFPSI